MVCSNCHSGDARRPGSQLCNACYMAHRRTGQPRTERNILRHNWRQFERDQRRR